MVSIFECRVTLHSSVIFTIRLHFNKAFSQKFTLFEIQLSKSCDPHFKMFHARLTKISFSPPIHPTNYRPISNLSFISKLVERAVHKQLSNYIESNSLLPLVQSGFRRLHSTETAVLKVYNDITLALDSGFITALLLLDFSSAFDCVDHSILLEVLELQFGITASALLWIANFLTNRSHLVRLGTNSSKYFNILF